MYRLNNALAENCQHGLGKSVSGEAKHILAQQLLVSRDEVEISVTNLLRLELFVEINRNATAVGPLGREFLRSVAD